MSSRDFREGDESCGCLSVRFCGWVIGRFVDGHVGGTG
jgi:hypothetical protein